MRGARCHDCSSLALNSVERHASFGDVRVPTYGPRLVETDGGSAAVVRARLLDGDFVMDQVEKFKYCFFNFITANQM